MGGIDEIGDSESKETNSAAGIVPGRQVESAFESGRSGESACGSGPRSEPKYGRLRHVNSPQSRWADSRCDARPPGPIVIVQSYGAVWSTEKHNPKQDLRASDQEPSAVSSTRAQNRTGNSELRVRRSNYRAPDLRISRRKTQDSAVSTEHQRRTWVSCGSIIVESFCF